MPAPGPLCRLAQEVAQVRADYARDEQVPVPGKGALRAPAWSQLEPRPPKAQGQPHAGESGQRAAEAAHQRYPRQPQAEEMTQREILTNHPILAFTHH